MKYVMAILLLASCKSVLCPTVTEVTSSFVSTIASQCGCNAAATAQLQSDVAGLLNVTGICSAPPKTGAISATVCPIAGSLLTGYVASKLPAGCANASGCVGNVVGLAVSACSLIPF